MLKRIEERLPELSRAEQRVARWVLSHPKRAAKSKLASIALACETSEPTVIRFCRHVGCEGFRDFTILLTEAMSRPAVYVHRSVSKDDTSADAVAKVMDASIRALVDIRARTSLMPFDETVAAIGSAGQLVFMGLGASGHVARDACHKFFRLGIPCSAHSDIPTILQMAATLNRGDVVIAISRSGQWPKLAQAAQLARDSGSIVVALTEPGSLLAGESEFLFPCLSIDDTSIYTPSSSRLAHLAVLDALQVALALNLGDAATKRLRRSKEAISDYAI